MQRTIIFGDIHGCYDEWMDLLEKTQATENDLIISTGDIIGKGPHSKKVLLHAIKMNNFKGVLGNFEWYLLHSCKNARPPIPAFQPVMREFGKDLEKCLNYLHRWPLYLKLRECLVVHAGLKPNIPLKHQKAEDLVNIRKVGPQNRPWYDYYEGRRLIVHGHWAKQGLVVRSNVVGLDTGCVYGKKLSAVILPEIQIVSVPARKTYVPIKTKCL